MPLAAILLLALAPAPQPAGTPGARVEVLDGRAILAGSGVVVRLQAGDPERWIDGPAHLELSAGSRARVTWTGEASLLLEGRNVLEWRPAADGGPPSWDLAEVGSAHLELRRGPLDVALCGGWGARLQSGACALRGLAGDGLELDHQAGLPLDLWPPQEGDAPSVPFTVLAGARLRLLPGTARPLVLGGPRAGLRDAHQRLGFERGRSAESFPAWRGFAWPWSSSVPALAIEAAVDGRPQARGTSLDLPEQFDLPVRDALPLRAATPDLSEAPGPLDVAPARESAPSATEPARDPAPAVPEVAPEQVPTRESAEATEQVRAQRAGPEPIRARAMREEGVLVMTPYGPRWIDKSRPVDPELLRIQAQRRRP